MEVLLKLPVVGQEIREEAKETGSPELIEFLEAYFKFRKGNKSETEYNQIYDTYIKLNYIKFDEEDPKNKPINISAVTKSAAMNFQRLKNINGKMP